MPPNNAPRKSFILKRFEDLGDADTNFGQAIDDRQSPRYPFWIERYIKGELHFHLHIRRALIPVEGELVTREYCAILERRVSGEHVVADDQVGRFVPPRSIIGTRSGADDDKLSMLVNTFK